MKVERASPTLYSPANHLLPELSSPAPLPAVSWGRLGFLAKVSPGVALFKSVIDPLLVGGMFLLLCYLYYGTVDGLMLCAGIMAFLLAGYMFDGSLLFLPGRRQRWRDLLTVLVGWLSLVGFMLLLAHWAGVLEYADVDLLALWGVLTPLALVAVHGAVALAVSKKAGVIQGHRRAVIVGATAVGRTLAQEMRQRPWLRFEVMGYFDDRPSWRTGIETSELLGEIRLLADFVRANGVQSIYITLPMTSQPRIHEILSELKDTTASVYFVPDLFVFDLIQARVDHVDGIPVISVCESPFLGINGLMKRASDLVLASLILLMIWPILLATAIAIKLTSPGPVIFKQRRYGLDGREIIVYKFRSMTITEDGGNSYTQVAKNDARVTRVGNFIRKTSIDELPQFINVLQGRMSIVGPRPHVVAVNEKYRKQIPSYMIRHKVKPGITGWAQVNGYRGGDDLESMTKRIQHDLDYLRNWSVWLDVKIIFRTALMMVHDQHAY